MWVGLLGFWLLTIMRIQFFSHKGLLKHNKQRYFENVWLENVWIIQHVWKILLNDYFDAVVLQMFSKTIYWSNISLFGLKWPFLVQNGSPVSKWTFFTKYVAKKNIFNFNLNTTYCLFYYSFWDLFSCFYGQRPAIANVSVIFLSD